MTTELNEPPALREADCPYCERRVLVYQEPPRCPLCDCPLDADRIRPFTFPEGEPTGADGPEVA